MKSILLKYLKLSKLLEIDGYLFCGKSVLLPGYHFFIKQSDIVLINQECSLESSIEDVYKDSTSWMITLLACNTLKDFEKCLFKDFSDIRNVLSRMELLHKISMSSEIQWVSCEKEKKTYIETDYARSSEVKDIDIMTLAEYDATMQFLASLKKDNSARYEILSSFTYMMSVLGKEEKPPSHKLESSHIVDENLMAEAVAKRITSEENENVKDLEVVDENNEHLLSFNFEGIHVSYQFASYDEMAVAVLGNVFMTEGIKSMNAS